jgi:hypothetical protein
MRYNPTRQENAEKENKTDLLRILFSFSAFSCLSERSLY